MFMAIAEDPAVVNTNHGSCLPGSWRSLYELTRLGDDLPVAIEAGEVKPDISRRHLTKCQQAMVAYLGLCAKFAQTDIAEHVSVSRRYIRA
ncbi:hypothetical protein BH24ACT15_BH24ACT15_24660 [soil metagenome]